MTTRKQLRRAAKCDADQDVLSHAPRSKIGFYPSNEVINAYTEGINRRGREILESMHYPDMIYMAVETVEIDGESVARLKQDGYEHVLWRINDPETTQAERNELVKVVQFCKLLLTQQELERIIERGSRSKSDLAKINRILGGLA